MTVSSRDIVFGLAGAVAIWWLLSRRRREYDCPGERAAPAGFAAELDDDGPDAELGAPCCGGCAAGHGCASGAGAGITIADPIRPSPAPGRPAKPPSIIVDPIRGGSIKPSRVPPTFSRTGGIIPTILRP